MTGVSAEVGELVPTYSDGLTSLYVGDCLQVLPRLGHFDLAVFDPPYNVGKGYPTGDDLTADEYEAWLVHVLLTLRADTLVYFPGVVNLALGLEVLRCTGWTLQRPLGWHKKEYAGDLFGGGPAMCWEPILWATRGVDRPFWNKTFGAWGRDFLVVNATHGNPWAKEHPCPKPMEVLRWLIGLFCPAGGSVIDPTVGSGSTLDAARLLGRSAVGIEIDPGYGDVSIKRLSHGVMHFDEPDNETGESRDPQLFAATEKASE